MSADSSLQLIGDKKGKKVNLISLTFCYQSAVLRYKMMMVV